MPRDRLRIIETIDAETVDKEAAPLASILVGSLLEALTAEASSDQETELVSAEDVDRAWRRTEALLVDRVDRLGGSPEAQALVLEISDAAMAVSIAHVLANRGARTLGP
jgi:hypothetical protein